MCFSVGASFTAGTVLTIIGVLSLQRAPQRYRLFAAIPFLFAMQQFSEGVLWLVLAGISKGSLVAGPAFIIMAPLGFLAKTFDTPDHVLLLKKAAIMTFLFFAFVIWPTWIPLACRRFELEGRRKQIISCLLVLGLCISAALLTSLILYGAHASAASGHIVYSVHPLFPALQQFGLLLYTIATMGPLFVSSLPGAPLFGAAVIASEVLAWYMWRTAFISTWCFFAAILSVMVLAIMPDKKHDAPGHQ